MKSVRLQATLLMASIFAAGAVLYWFAPELLLG